MGQTFFSASSLHRESLSDETLIKYRYYYNTKTMTNYCIRSLKEM